MTSEQAFLLQKAEDSLRAAKLLADNALYDFAASRAYYTMFYIAQAFLLEDGLSFSSHTAVISAFGREFARSSRVPQHLHRCLIDAAEVRTEGDYSTQNRLNAETAAEQIAYAEEFCTIAQQSLNN